LAGDRVVSIILGAAYEGIFDLARFDPREPSWPAVLTAASAELVRRRAVQVYTAQLHATAVYLSILNLTEESRRAQMELISKTMEGLRANVEPWNSGGRQEAAASKADRLAAYYRQVVGRKLATEEGGGHG
jgi:hypothetical protein